ncbi:MAG: hypothetical protein AAGH68_11835 [Pseudomonadota bacterium]
MSRLPHVLFAWEMGDNFGHVSKIAEVARHLAGKAELTIAVRNPIALRQIAPDLPCRLLAAPVAPPIGPLPSDQIGKSYPEVLRPGGWSRVADLSPLTEAWRSLIALVRPDVLAVQGSPTCLLAARGNRIPTLVFGSGFDLPPRAHPMPRFMFWDKPDSSSREEEVRAIANKVLEANNQPELERFCDLLHTDAFMLATFPEIDHYGPRTQFEKDHPPYLGQLFTTDTGKEMQWRTGARTRVLAYLRPGQHGFEPGVKALARLDRKTDVILAAPGATKSLAQSLANTAIRLVNGPVRLDGLLPDCDLGVSHASNGMASAFALAGVPQVGLPMHSEQVMVARTIALNRLGLGVIGQFGPDQAYEAITKTLQGQHLKDATVAVAKRVNAAYPDGPAPAIAARILEMA